MTNVGAGGAGVMKSRASYVGTTAQPCSTCQVATPWAQWMASILCSRNPNEATTITFIFFVVIVNLTKLLSQICFKAVTTESD